MMAFSVMQSRKVIKPKWKYW